MPSSYINKKKVIECNEPLVPLPDDGRLFRTDGHVFVGREGMVRRLVAAAETVAAKGFKLHIYQTYRSPDEQSERRKELYNELRNRFPDYDDREIVRMLNMGIAGVGGGHQTGGAVDLGLCDQNGNDCDMGTHYMEHNAKTATRCDGLNSNQKTNREILTSSMHDAGFANYPAEWWHYCYGDKMWAAYKNKRSAIYTVKQLL